MKFFLATFLVAIMVALAMAAADQKPIIVSYPDKEHTPYSEMEELKAAIKEVGGVIVHEYNLIMGLAAKVPADFEDTIKTMGADYHVEVEEDSDVHTMDDNN